MSLPQGANLVDQALLSVAFASSLDTTNIHVSEVLLKVDSHQMQDTKGRHLMYRPCVFYEHVLMVDINSCFILLEGGLT
ncbi:hypothetical protein HHK36_032777 [Tetracentron sinense]|uniref:Uncharacterized protein n=1 Tax=Tetracentron sinense TaxID=13715 RepID=A0A834Y9Q1_TETSI|nr:hypothetical protein HHK36_032777 [Tetracentron sinense]